MSARRTPGSSQGDRVARATALIRALKGVVDARVEMDASGVRTVAVVVEPALSAWEITRNVQSALLASLGLAIDTAIVEVTRPPADSVPPEGPAPAAGEPAPAAKPPRGNGTAANGKARANGSGRPAANGKVSANGGKASWAAHANGKSSGKANGAAPPPLLDAQPASAPARKRLGATVARLELETRALGRIGCRVVVATSDRIAAGESEGVDTPAGRLEAVARAVVAACRIPGADLDAVRLVELAGRKYVIVAVRAWSGRDTIYRAEVAAADASPEAAAADATLGALVQ